MSLLSAHGSGSVFSIIAHSRYPLCTSTFRISSSSTTSTSHSRWPPSRWQQEGNLNATTRRVRFSSTNAAVATPVARSNNPPSAINPPASTLPPPLNTPTRQPSQSAPSYYFALGRSYLSFYKTGLKAVWSNYKAAQAIRARLPSSSSSPSPQLLLSRSDFQLLRRASSDARRIPLFLLLFMVFGEFTPLVVVFAGAVVPRTCKIPVQIRSERKTAEQRRLRSFREGTLEPGQTGRGEWTGRIEELSREQKLHVGRTLGLYGGVWDYLGGFPGWWLRWRIRSWLAYLDADDTLIEKAAAGGELKGLSEEETRVACEERGLDVLERSDVELKGLLRQWLELRKDQKVPATRLLLSRPNVWHESAAAST